MTTYTAQKQNSQLQRKYGLTVYAYNQMIQRQGGGCAICQRIPLATRALCVDHCHRTGVIRGLLCDACNKSLGKFEDSPRLLASALVYLLKESA